MPRPHTVFVCEGCGYESARWMGRCPGCGAWNTLLAAVDADPNPRAEREPLTALSVLQLPERAAARWASGIGEFDRVLGGGIVSGTLVLLGGDPGVGKSTLLLQVASRLAQTVPVLYASGEESAPQLRARAVRLGALAPGLLVAAETDVEAIAALCGRHRPQLLVVDSVQTARPPDGGSVPGSPVQVAQVGRRLLELAKSHDVAVVLVGHVTKAGMLAGPRLLEHLVDVVLLFEGERLSPYRLLRPLKNRFGSTQELGVFQMGEGGLAEVPNPSALFLAERARGVPGAVVGVSGEGSRFLLCEVQALLASPAFGVPRRTAAGLDGARLALLLAVLEKRCGLRCAQMDAYVKVAGGIRLEEPAADLACALALVSAYLDTPVPADAVAIGEIGLGGEVRGVARIAERLAEASRLGFRRALVPAAADTAATRGAPPLAVTPVATLREAVQAVFGPAAP
jgi:DNA repair protein RadA/Sms